MTGAMLIVLAGPAGASCPAGKAGKLSSVESGLAEVFDWRPDAGATFAADETAKLEFAFIPFDGPGSKTLYVYDSNSGSNFVILSFAGDGTTSAGVDYVPGKWNNVELVADFDEDEWTVTINGIESSAQAFTTPVSSMTEPTFEYYDGDGDTTRRTAWIDTLRVRKMTATGSVTLLVENFNEAPAEAPITGEISVRKPDTYEAGAGASCPTKTTLAIEKSAGQLVAKGRVTPPHPGEEVVVKLFKKISGEFVRVSTKRPTLGAASRYEAAFNRPNANQCKVVAKFPADEDHLTSGKAKLVDC